MKSKHTQSAVAFPKRRLADWYTLTMVYLGSGGFSSVQEALDDREVLWQLSDLWDVTKAPKADYELRDDPSLDEMYYNKVKDWQRFAMYLSLFNLESLVNFFQTLFPDDTHIVLSSYRYEFILQMTRKWAREYQNLDLTEEEIFYTLHTGDDEEVLRPTVAIKVIKFVGSDKSVDELIRGAKTEVFGLGNVSSKKLPVDCASMTFDVEVENITEEIAITNIVCLLDYFFEPGGMGVTGQTENSDTYYIVLSKTNGPDLLKLLRSVQSRMPRPLPGMFVWYVAWVLAHALERSHEKKIIHNDVKLENVMYDEPTGGVTLIDFGLSCHARIGKREVFDSCDAMGGTPSYSSPEMWTYGKRYPVSDVWALGVLLWEIATGTVYLLGKTPELIRDEILRGAKPDMKWIIHTLPHHEKFTTLLEKIFQEKPQKRLTAKQVIEYIYEVFSSDMLGPLNTESARRLGTYLYQQGNAALQEKLKNVQELKLSLEGSTKAEIVELSPATPKRDRDRESSLSSEMGRGFMTPPPKKSRDT
jgi:serine/threonine protein kinase